MTAQSTSKVDYIYYDVILENNNENLNFVNASFSQTLQDNVISGDTSEWMTTITRFRIPTTSIPILYWQNNYYYLTIQDPAGNNYQQPVQYISQSNNNNVAGIYSFTSIVQMINNTLTAIWASIPVPPNPNPPFIDLNESTQLLSLVFPANDAMTEPWFANQNAPATPSWKLMMNFPLFQLMPSFPSRFLKFPPNNTLMDNIDYIINTYQFPGNFYPHPSSQFPSLDYDQLIVTQEFTTIYKFNQLTSIFVTTNRIPVVRENIGNAQLSATSSVQTIGLNALQTLPIFMDFEPNATSVFSRNYFQYNAVYPRYVSMLQQNSLKEIDLSFYWVGNYANGEIYPIQLAPGDSLTCKIQFLKRSVLVRSILEEQDMSNRYKGSGVSDFRWSSSSGLNPINPSPAEGNRYNSGFDYSRNMQSVSFPKEGGKKKSRHRDKY
jgi:hypothetical protein